VEGTGVTPATASRPPTVGRFTSAVKAQAQGGHEAIGRNLADLFGIAEAEEPTGNLSENLPADLDNSLAAVSATRRAIAAAQNAAAEAGALATAAGAVLNGPYGSTAGSASKTSNGLSSVDHAANGSPNEVKVPAAIGTPGVVQKYDTAFPTPAVTSGSDLSISNSPGYTPEQRLWQQLDELQSLLAAQTRELMQNRAARISHANGSTPSQNRAKLASSQSTALVSAGSGSKRSSSVDPRRSHASTDLAGSTGPFSKSVAHIRPGMADEDEPSVRAIATVAGGLETVKAALMGLQETHAAEKLRAAHRLAEAQARLVGG
jgi:hypothetical protein